MYSFSNIRTIKKKSKVWNLFGVINDSNGQEIPHFVGCKKCMNVYTYNKSTSNLVRHKCYTLGITKQPNVEESTVSIKTNKKININCTEITHSLKKH